MKHPYSLIWIHLSVGQVSRNF